MRPGGSEGIRCFGQKGGLWVFTSQLIWLSVKDKILVSSRATYGLRSDKMEVRERWNRVCYQMSREGEVVSQGS